MDEYSRGLAASLFLSLILVTGLVAHAFDMEYIPPAKRQKLQTQFEQARINEQSLEKWQQVRWTCDMFGMQRHLQIRRNLNLYDFRRVKAGEWKNNGAQMVVNYQFNEGQLKGKTGRFYDEVRLTQDGQLISRLTLDRFEGAVVAYAVCQAGNAARLDSISAKAL